MKKYLHILCLTFLMLFTQNCQRFESGSSSGSSSSGTDPLLGYAWHLNNTGQTGLASQAGTAGSDMNLLTTWNDEILGDGVKVLVSDDGVESGHIDLADNYDLSFKSKNYTLAAPYLANTSEPQSSSDNHGTSVSGLIAAVSGNAYGSRGVASKASIVSANFLSDLVSQTTAVYVDQADGDFDVFNQSWGETENIISDINASYETQLLDGVTNLRSGKGASYVKAAGNSFTLDSSTTGDLVLGNANFDSTNSTPYTINVAALNANSTVTTYSSPGANMWISSFGGEDGVSKLAMITTDRSTCSLGYSRSNPSPNSAFQRGNSKNRGCNFTSTFNGTSSAAPLVSGAVALLYEANPALTWRDVKFILASTATKNHATATSFENPLYTADPTTYASYKSPTGYVYEQGWVTNGAGFNFHNWYGFGRINVDAAVAMAKTYVSTLGTFGETTFADTSGTISVAIPDFSSVGASDIIAVTTDIKIEAVQIKVNITHNVIGELAIELTSPAGTKSILANMNNSLEAIVDYTDDRFLTNAFYQESSMGNWTIKIIDGHATETGTLTEWSINFIGAP